MFVTSEGSPTARFQRALATGNPNIALAAAAELRTVTLSDALALCRLLAESSDTRYPRAAARWLERLAMETGAGLGELQLAAGALARLSESPGDGLAIDTLEALATGSGH